MLHLLKTSEIASRFTLDGSAFCDYVK